MSMKFDKMGWYVAVALAGAMFGMGFKAPGDKVGSVDIGKIFQDSDYSKKQQESLRQAKLARQGILDLIKSYSVMKPEDAQKFATLTLSPTPGPTDKAEEDRITQAAKDSDTLYRALATKSNLTPAEQSEVDDFNRRKDQIIVLQGKWAQEYNDQLGQMADKLQTDAIAKIRDAIGQIAREQGFSVVFSNAVAPYSANDMTDAATKLMNKTKS